MGVPKTWNTLNSWSISGTGSLETIIGDPVKVLFCPKGLLCGDRIQIHVCVFVRPCVRPSGMFLITFWIGKTHDSKGFGPETGSETGPKVTKVSAPDQSDDNWCLVTLVTYFE